MLIQQDNQRGDTYEKMDNTIFIISLSTLSGCSNSKSLYSDEGQVFRKVIPQDMTTFRYDIDY